MKHGGVVAGASLALGVVFCGAGCEFPGGVAPYMALDTPAQVDYVAASSRKVCQITGDADREARTPTVNQTWSRYGLLGMDLGASFEHKGRLHMLFGDTWSADSVGRPIGSDSIGISDTTVPALDCVRLDFMVASDGRYQPLTVPGVSLGEFEVPTGGFSLGASLYINVTTDHSAAHVMGRSVLAKSDDDGHTFRALYDVSTQKFINVAPVVQASALQGGLPEGTVLFWGSGAYRASNVYFAYSSIDGIETKSNWRYFAGLQGDQPIWSPQEGDAQPLFDQPCVGEFSVQWNRFINRWLMLYNCDSPGGINYRTAEHPWGPWSVPQVLYDTWADGGYCHYVHTSDDWLRTDRHMPPCDHVSDLGRENEWGGVYGPYLIDRFTTGIEGQQTTVYFALSTWNPYGAVLMKSTLRVRNASR